MNKKLWHFLVDNRAILLIATFLVASTGGLVLLQYQQIRAHKGQTVPLNVSQNNTVSSQTTIVDGNPSTSKGGGNESGGHVSTVLIRLSEGQAQPQPATPVPAVAGEPLSESEVAQLLARLPTLPTIPGDQGDFRLAQQPIPPPLTGETLQQTFPPTPEPLQPAAVESGPLKVLRFAPEGEIPIAPFVNITFNQPMVSLTTIGQLAAEQVPAKMEPSLPGTWRWLGTQVLNFQYDSALIDRLPKATNYHITVPAGTRSATGGILTESVEWSFSTPPVKMISSYPQGEPQPRDPLFFIQFDQRIDPAAVLQTIRVSAGNQSASLRLANDQEIKANEKWGQLLKGATEGRWVAFRAQEPLPSDAEVTVTINPGTPSAEGPLLTQAAQTYSFRTYAALRIEDHACGWSGNANSQCQPLEPFTIRFNNSIDTKTYTNDMLRIEPELPGASVNIYGNSIVIQGFSKAQTTYTITVSGRIQDIFGQTLGQDQALNFRVGPANPQLYGPSESFITLDPGAKKPLFSVYDLNYPRLDLRIYAVQPSDWPAFKQYLRDFQRNDISVTVPGREVVNKTIPVELAADSLTEVNIDLSEVMDGPFGQFIVIVQPPVDLLQDKQNQYKPTAQAWVQVTQIGLDAFSDHSEIVAWTTDLKNGAPLNGVKITAQPTGQQAATGADGTVRFAIPDGSIYLVASQGADQALLPKAGSYWGDDTWIHQPINDELRWYVFDDRQMYRPGEDVHVKGWLRRIGGKQTGDVGMVGSELKGVHYQITDAQGNNIGSGRVDVNALGGFDFVYQVPQKVNLGYTQIQLNPDGAYSGLDGQGFIHTFQIEEFRRPEFEVTARNETTGPYFAGDHAVVAVDAKYYAGGGLPNAAVTWQVTTSPAQYAPPNWPDFTFGTWRPWWENDFSRMGKPFGPGMPYGGGEVKTFTGQTDASGTHFLRLDFDQSGKAEPVSVLAQASVMDVNRQAWTGTTSLLVHPASLYVGLRSEPVFVERGTPLKVAFIVTDLDGKPVADRPVEMQAARLDWKLRDGTWQEVEADVQTCTQGSQPEPVTCTFQTPVGGSYRITATVTDDKGRQNQSQLTRWVSGGKIPQARKVEQEKATLIPDRESYQPGDVAQILVQSPFSPAEGLLTVTRSGIVSTERFHIEDGTTTLQVPINEGAIPNLNIQVDLNGAAQRSDDQGNPLPDLPARPAFASGQLNLRIPPVQRTLAVQVTPGQPELEPGGETTVNVLVKDPSGQPVPDAELSVVVVDEAVLALSNYQMADPLSIFYTDRPADLMSVYSRSSIILSNPAAMAQSTASHQNGLMRAADQSTGAMPMAMEAPAAAAAPTQAAGMSAKAYGGAQNSGPAQPIRARIDFNPLAVFSPAVHTDANGSAQVAVKLPDNLTRYRIMVVAVDSGRRFGMGESNLTARLPLMVRPSAPRFLNFGDQFVLPVVLQNQTGQPLTVDVALQASNLELTGQKGLRVTVPARNRVEVLFPATTQTAGTARVQIAAASGTFADAATIELPVYTPATTEAFATYGVIDQGAAAQPVAAPEGVFPQFGGLEISTSSTALQALTDAVLYLVSYPFDCTEQIASRVLAVAALRDVLTAFNAQGMPSPQEMEARVQQDVQMLQGLQNEDGGFPYWRRGQESIPFNTIHTAQALYRAKSKGFNVPADMQQRALEYLRQIENHYPAWYSQRTRQTLSAYALYTRSLMGDRVPSKALKLISEAGGIENLSLDAIGWLWPVLKDAPEGNAQVDAIRRYVNNHVVETAGAANFTTNYDDQNYLLLGSNRRTDAILLDAMINDNPQHDLIPKVVNGLLAHRTRGAWTNTQENVFVLLALDRYFNTFEAQTPDFVARIWLGQTYAGSSEFHGRTTDRKETDVPMAFLVDPNQGGGATQNLILQKEGAGRLYYRLGLRYAPTNLNLDPLDMGFTVQRTYEAVDSPADVSQDAQGAWHIKAGARVRVYLTMVANNRRYHVALVDPLPAGLEIMNPTLAVTGGLPVDPNSDAARKMSWWGPWYEHQNLRDERAEAFTSLLWDGVYQYSYIARATTPGRFIAPPAKAEEMYSPEVFGRSGSNVVIVE